MAQLERATSRRGKKYTASGIAKFDEIEADFVKTTTLESDYLKADEITFSNISGGTATFGGTDNGDGVVEVKNAAGTNIVLLNKDGITLADGAQLINATGVLTSLTTESFNMSWYDENLTQQEFGLWFLGYMTDNTTKNWGSFLELNINIPTGFTVKSAYITLEHKSMYWNIQTAWGYCRNVKAYKVTADSYVYSGDYNSEYQTSGSYTMTEISGAFGTNGFTAQTPSATPITETTTSIDIAASMATGNNKIVIKSSDSVPTFNADVGTNIGNLAPKTGLARARIMILGYTS